MKTLFFIGNGFDIAHDIKSRYKDFRDFMNASKEYDDLVTMLEELSQSKNTDYESMTPEMVIAKQNS